MITVKDSLVGMSVKCTDQSGNTVDGVITDVMLGACRGGGLATVKGVWPGRTRASLRDVELADLEVV